MKPTLMYSKLRSKIKELYGEERIFAEALGITKVTMSHKMNNKNYWKQDEMFLAMHLLGLDIEEISEYFFSELKYEKEDTI